MTPRMALTGDGQDGDAIAMFNALWENNPMPFLLKLTPLIKGVQISCNCLFLRWTFSCLFKYLVRSGKSDNFLPHSNSSDMFGLYSRQHLKASIHYSKKLCSNNFIHSNHLLTQTCSTHSLTSQNPQELHTTFLIHYCWNDLPWHTSSERSLGGGHVQAGAMTERSAFCSWKSLTSPVMPIRFLFPSGPPLPHKGT